MSLADRLNFFDLDTIESLYFCVLLQIIDLAIGRNLVKFIQTLLLAFLLSHLLCCLQHFIDKHHYVVGEFLAVFFHLISRPRKILNVEG